MENSCPAAGICACAAAKVILQAKCQYMKTTASGAYRMASREARNLRGHGDGLNMRMAVLMGAARRLFLLLVVE